MNIIEAVNDQPIEIQILGEPLIWQRFAKPEMQYLLVVNGFTPK